MGVNQDPHHQSVHGVNQGPQNGVSMSVNQNPHHWSVHGCKLGSPPLQCPWYKPGPLIVQCPWCKPGPCRLSELIELTEAGIDRPTSDNSLLPSNSLTLGDNQVRTILPCCSRVTRPQQVFVLYPYPIQGQPKTPHLSNGALLAHQLSQDRRGRVVSLPSPTSTLHGYILKHSVRYFLHKS